MKHVLKFAAAMLGVFAVGCGGSGNGVHSTFGTVLNGSPRVEAIVKVLPTNLMHPNNWTAAQLDNPQTPGLQADLIDPTVFGVQDPNNIEAGEQMVFQVVFYSTDTNGNVVRNIEPGATFVSSDQTSVYGTLAGNTGDFIAGAAPTVVPLTITGTFNGLTYSTTYQIKIQQIRLLGTVLTQGTNAAQLAGSQVQFFNASGVLVDTVTIAYDGTIRASVPSLATSFTIVADSMPQSFYQSFSYLGLQYDAGLVGCFAPVQLPSGVLAGTFTLPATIYAAPRVQGQSAPPATGCSDGPKAHVVKKG